VNAPPPFANLTLEGYAIMRGVVVAWPVPAVARMLPNELTLGAQSLTPTGTHPVVLFFYHVMDARMSVPTLLPPLTYREHIVGVPYTFAACDDPRCDGHGPLFYMPTLRLDNFMAVSGGVAYWGFRKSLADVIVSSRVYDVFEPRGARLIALDYETRGAYESVTKFPHLERLRVALDQPVVGQFPMGTGAFIAASRFERRWSDAGARPFVGTVKIERAYVPGMIVGEIAVSGIDETLTGGFELSTHWRLGLPFPATEL
jgi:hypothetical protein